MSILKDVFLSLNSVDLSDQVMSIETPDNDEAVADTVMGDIARSNEVGLQNWSLAITFKQNYAAAKVDATLAAIRAGGVAVPIEYRPTTSAVSATNPKWTGNAILTDYTGIGGGVGDEHTATVSFISAGALTRATS